MVMIDPKNDKLRLRLILKNADGFEVGGDIVETGSAEDDIVESGSQADNIIEDGS